MEDRDGKKPFIIPKTHASNKDVLISEKIGSRNVIELFDDIKSCSLQSHYDFRQNQCKSCDIIRNQKLQKIYNERKLQMKKEQDPTERLAFHLITSRNMAVSIATEGLNCGRLAFPIEKYLGNPKDGIHLSRRPDVLLASSGAQGLYSFGLLVCKILLGKGYATIPSINNKQLSAQIHFDYHFCKIQAMNKEQGHINEILANSLIFCYEHEEFQTRSHPSQILPIAVLWYDLKEKFPTELTPTSEEPQPRKLKHSFKKKPLLKPLTSANTGGTWDKPIENIPNTSPIQKTPTKYSNQFLIPISSLYTSFCNSQIDPPLNRKVIASETIPLSPQNSIRDLSPSLKQTINEKKLPSKDIPLNSSTELIDPRLKTLQQTRHVFYLESKAVKHALQQQKRLNNYCGSTSKTNYTLIPFHVRSMSAEDYERQNQWSKNSSPLFISVIDCFHFGLKKSSNKSYIDLEENENQIAYEQIERSSQLIEQERELNSQEIRLYVREKRQRKIQEQIYQQRKTDLANAKIHIHNGRKLLKEHQQIDSSKKQISLELMDFFSYEYRNENRPHVKRILAELIGILVEKYGHDYAQLMAKITEASLLANQTMDPIVDMELELSSSQGLGDRDERFRVQTPPPPPSLLAIQIHNEPNISFDQTDNHINQPLLVASTVLTNDNVLTANDETNNNIMDDQSKQIIVPNLSIKIEDNSDHSRDVFVKLLTHEAFTSTSSSPTQTVSPRRQSQSDDDDDDDENETGSNNKLSSTRTVMLISNNHEDNLIIKTTNIDPPEETEEEEEEQEEEQQPTVKRIKVDLISPPILPPLMQISPLVTPSDDHDYRQDLDERRRLEEISRSRSQSASSHNSSIKESNPKSPATTNHRYGRQQRRRYEQNRSSNRSHHHHQQRNKPNSTPSRHQRFNYNHQSVADHPRFAHLDTIPSLETNFNYNSFSTSNYSQNQNVNSSFHNDSPSDYPYYQNNYIPQPPPLMSATPLMNYSNTYDLKPSNTIERLQMLLENTTPSFDPQPSSYAMGSAENSNHQHWPSSRYPSGNSSDQTNQTFTRNDAEQLLMFVQRFRN